MTTYTTYTFEGGAEIKLELGAERTEELEEKIGGSIAQKLPELEKMSVAVEFIAAAIVDGAYKDRRQTAFAIYDDMRVNGKTYRDYIYLIYEVLTRAGFIDAGTAARQKETDAAQMKLEETLHAAQMKLITEKTAAIADVPASSTPSQT